jgi:hypothetical protein
MWKTDKVTVKFSKTDAEKPSSSKFSKQKKIMKWKCSVLAGNRF